MSRSTQDACDPGKSRSMQDACDPRKGQSTQDACGPRKGRSTEDACDPRKGQSTQDACDPRKDPATWLAIASSERSPRYKKLHKKVFLWDQLRQTLRLLHLSRIIRPGFGTRDLRREYWP